MKRWIYASKDEYKLSWSEIKDQLEDEFEVFGALPLYTDTAASKLLNELCRKVERKMGVIVEYPDSNRKKNVVIRDAKDGSVLGKVHNYYFNDDILNCAFNAKDESDFQKKYSKYIDGQCD